MTALDIRRISGHYFLRHFLEMLAAMIAGMMVLGLIVSSLFGALGHANLYHYAALRAVLMACYMTAGMGLWMRHRGHSWPRIGEMSAAMFAPFLVLLVPFWTGAISGGVLLAGGHVLMLPAMLGAMLYRRQEYSKDHRAHAQGSMPVAAHLMHR
jgi:flagellar biosynthetic protein FliP